MSATIIEGKLNSAGLPNIVTVIMTVEQTVVIGIYIKGIGNTVAIGIIRACCCHSSRKSCVAHPLSVILYTISIRIRISRICLISVYNTIPIRILERIRNTIIIEVALWVSCRWCVGRPIGIHQAEHYVFIIRQSVSVRVRSRKGNCLPCP